MDQNEIIEGMAVEEIAASNSGGILSLALKVAKAVVIPALVGGAGYLVGRFCRKRASKEEAIDYETDDYEDITEDDDENPVDSDVE